MSNTKTRILSALIIGNLFIVSILWMRTLFYVIMFFVAGMMLIEWYRITRTSNFFTYLGLILIPIPIAALLIISKQDVSGWILLTYFSIIWTVDTMAMVGGKSIGGKKLAPTLSPHKTISGLIVGVTLGALIPYLLALIIPNYDISYAIIDKNTNLTLHYASLAFLAQMSDLFISFFKRKFKVKDSGTIIPGHGGMLDRFDSIILTAPILMLYLNGFLN